MTTIDQLVDLELAESVELKLGMRRLKHGWWWYEGVAYFIGETYPNNRERPDNFYRPDRDIAQAWELDGEGWYWSQDDDGIDCNVTVEANDEYYEAAEPWEMHPTKAAAYATARCRAYLKARDWTPDEVTR